MAHANAVHSTAMPDSSPLDAVIDTASAQLSQLRIHRIVGEPDRTDAEKLVANLRQLAAIIDPVVAAIGRYANHHFGWVDQRLFTSQLLNALEGDATFVIQEAAENFILEQHGLR
jgi:hypothetical protein